MNIKYPDNQLGMDQLIEKVANKIWLYLGDINHGEARRLACDEINNYNVEEIRYYLSLGDGPVKAPKPDVGLRFNSNKPKHSLIPSISRDIEALGWMVGAAKYGEYNWEKGMDWSTPINCMSRHWEKINSGEWIDEETGVPHIALIMCNSTMLAYYYYHDKGNNDLPLRAPLARELDFSTEILDKVKEEYKGKRSTDETPVMPTKDKIK